MRYRTELTDKIITSDWAKEILNMISPVYGNDYVSLWLYQVIGSQLDKISEWSDEYKQQLVPQTATWALPLWESEYGLVSNPNMTIEQRRQNVINKMWSRLPMNPERFCQFISVIAGADVRIQERTGKNKFTIYISSVPNLVNEVAVKKEIDTLKPSHLVYGIVYERWLSNTVHLGGVVQTYKEVTLMQT